MGLFHVLCDSLIKVIKKNCANDVIRELVSHTQCCPNHLAFGKLKSLCYIHPKLPFKIIDYKINFFIKYMKDIGLNIGTNEKTINKMVRPTNFPP